MSDTVVSKQRSPFFKSVRRGKQKALTFLGVPANTILVFFAVVLLILNVLPFLSLLISSFTVSAVGVVPSSDWDITTWNVWEQGPREYVAQGSLTLYNWWTILFSSDLAVGNFWLPLARSLLVSVFACIFSILFGGLMAFMITRTNMPFKKFIGAIFIFPYIMPQWTLALFWKNFFITTEFTAFGGELQALTGLIVPQWMVYGWFPIAMVLGLHYTPFAYILIGGVLQNMDSNLEEAATILNIPKWKRFTRVTIPMLKPALFSTILLVFSSAMSSYSVPMTLGNPTNYFTLATRMKSLIEGSGGRNIGSGYAVAIVLILIGVVMLIMNQMQTGSRKQFTTVTGKSGQISKRNLGKVGRWIIGIVLSFFVAIVCFGPMISFFLESLLKNSGDFSGGLSFAAWISKEPIGNASAGYVGLLNEKRVWSALLGSIGLSVACGFFAGLCGLLIGYAVSRRRKAFLGVAVNNIAFFPYLMPSVVLSLIFMIVASKLGIPVSTTGVGIFIIMVIVGVIKYIPFASRTSLNAMLQLSEEIEEAGQIMHIPWWKRMTHIIFPIQKAAIISGFLLPFISCMRELDLFVFLGSDYFILTRFMFMLEDTGVAALENAANFLLIIFILGANYLVNILTGASMDKGIGGSTK
ncbi:MAG: iron ABC transporter permease [Bacilli bacterium]|nr:iron ABC transporter permease [Bacilli bacterium]